MEKKLASVIVPIYKVEQYLNACVESIVNNSKEFLPSLEILLVDDGSPDNCPAICDELEKKYEVVKALHKPNGGLSHARNHGVEHAEGKYLIFVDSDDTVNEKFYDMLKFISENDYDFVECGCTYLDGEKTELWNNKEADYIDATEEDKADILKNKLQATAWSKVVNREFFVKSALYFRNGFIHEDEHYMPRLVAMAKSIRIINFNWYDYYVRGGSIITNFSNKNVTHLLDNMKDLMEYTNNLKCGEVLKTALRAHITRTSCGALTKANRIKKQDRKQYYIILKQYKDLFKKAYNTKQKITFALIKIFGFRFTVVLMKIVK